MLIYNGKLIRSLWILKTNPPLAERPKFNLVRRITTALNDFESKYKMTGNY